jgi:hypothetical protein
VTARKDSPLPGHTLNKARLKYPLLQALFAFLGNNGKLRRFTMSWTYLGLIVVVGVIAIPTFLFLQSKWGLNVPREPEAQEKIRSAASFSLSFATLLLGLFSVRSIWLVIRFVQGSVSQEELYAELVMLSLTLVVGIWQGFRFKRYMNHLPGIAEKV